MPNYTDMALFSKRMNDVKRRVQQLATDAAKLAHEVSLLEYRNNHTIFARPMKRVTPKSIPRFNAKKIEKMRLKIRPRGP